MDNSEPAETDRLDAIARLLELSGRYGVTTGAKVGALKGASAEHQREFGHPLRFGCCAAPADAA